LLGKRRLEAALAQFAHRDRVEVVWRAFELDRGAPSGPRRSSFDAHRLSKLAGEHGSQSDLNERIMRAHLEEGESIGDPATLERLAIDVGLPPTEVRAVLRSDRFAREVRLDEELARAAEILTVPFFAVDRDLVVAGAQPVEVLLDLLQQSWERR
jgi:predicted DsbA family dithiol-disulfide isomerase